MKNLGEREGVFLFRLRDFIFCEGVFAMRMKHPPFSSVVQGTELPSLSTERHLVFPLKASFALHKGDIKKGMKNAFTGFTGM